MDCLVKRIWSLKPLRAVLTMALALVLLPAWARADSEITITVDSSKPGAMIPDDFAGLSYETKLLLPGEDGKHVFSPDNKLLINLFKQLGLRNLRVGGNTVDNPAVAIPQQDDIDNLFGFANAAGIKVIYSLRLKQTTDPSDDVKTAAYVMSHYRSNLDCLSIGNEPNVYEKEYQTYRVHIEKFMTAVTATVPDAMYCGPSATPGKADWVRQFAVDFGPGGKLAYISQHSYCGGDARKVTSPAAGRDKLLSPAIYKSYRPMDTMLSEAATNNHLPFRIEEANSFYNGGAKDVSDTLASALWALDFLHWWAARGAIGINFHTGDSVAAGSSLTSCHYATYWTSPTGYNVHPIGYAIKAFDLGSHGRITPVTVSPSDAVNLTAYAVSSDQGGLFVTIINKEHGAAAQSAAITLAPGSNYQHGQTQTLTSSNGDVADTTGMLLGGSSIGDDASWNGRWTPITRASASDPWKVHIAPASAVVINLTEH
jgi:hypothetical protein